MSAQLDFFDTYTLVKIFDKHKPENTFFKDRYFPTRSGDIFNSDKVLIEYRNHNRKMAPFVSRRVGDIPLDREGFQIHEFAPPYIGVSRTMSEDDLKQRGFGEALYSNSTPAQRAARLQLEDMVDLDEAITRREEWMCVQTMLNNECEVQEYVDKKTKGEKNIVRFYDGTSDHTYTTANKWNSANGNAYADICAMAKQLIANGLPAADLILGSDAAEQLLKDPEILKRLDANLAINSGVINENLEYPGVVSMGRLNFHGIKLNIFDVSESYEDDNGVTQTYFPTTSAMVTAPKCGHMMYGRISQIPYLGKIHETFAKKRVPKFLVEDDVRKLRLGSRPLAAPLNYCPYIHAANVVG